MRVDRGSGSVILPRTESGKVANLPEYVPPKVWTWNKPSGGRFANINRPISGPTHDKDLPVGRHPLQLYSLGTPNGVKVTIMLRNSQIQTVVAT